MGNLYYNNFSSRFNDFTIVWNEIGSELLIKRIFISNDELNSETKAIKSFKQLNLKSNSQIELLGKKIQAFFKGEEVKFETRMFDFTICSEIQRRVLLADFEIPRGWVSTYKRISNHIGLHNGARVIGNALARNPFPIIIPCHRAIKSDGDLGGYQGGVTMKRALLELEGIKFSDKGKVIIEKIFY